jgi:hypothetical protein
MIPNHFPVFGCMIVYLDHLIRQRLRRSVNTVPFLSSGPAFIGPSNQWCWLPAFAFRTLPGFCG